LQFFLFNSFLQREKLYIGIQGGQRCDRRVDFRNADGVGAVKDLTLQVGEVDPVRVGDGQPADAARGEVERRRATEAARADDERVRSAQPLLAFDADFGEQDVAAVAEELLVVQVVKVSRKISSLSRRAWSARSRAAGS
jgi:hypothetical protein